MDENQQEQIPLFFKEPVIINADEHKNSNFIPEENYNFAANANLIPIAIAEFEQAASSYPIVFSSTSDPAAFAVTGLRTDENVYVDTNGQWDEGAYIPAYVRKYPFLFMESSDGEQLTLCIEKQNLAEGENGTPIYENGEPSEIVASSLEFCSSFHASWNQTKEFTLMLHEKNLLTEQRADIETGDGAQVAFEGFFVVDREQYSELSNSALNEMSRESVAAINSHFVSTHCWKKLISLPTVDLPLIGAC